MEDHPIWLRSLKPETRLILYASFATFWRNRYDCLHPKIVALLPRTQREQGGQRHLSLFTLATRPEERLSFAAFVPWEDAYSLLHPFLYDPSENIRTLTFHTLIQVAQYEQVCLPEVLQLVCAHLHEPDPVRRKIVDHLSELPRSIWRSEHLEALEQIIQSIINAFDTSSYTVGALLLLIMRTLPCAPEWSSRQLAFVAQKRGLTFNYACLEQRLSGDDIRQIEPALQPVLTSWAERGGEETLEQLVSLFGKRVRVFNVLLDAIGSARLDHLPNRGELSASVPPGSPYSFPQVP